MTLRSSLLFAAAVVVAAAPLFAQQDEPGEATPDVDVTPQNGGDVTGVMDAIETETNPLEDKRIQPVINTTWVEECGSCHVPYQPTLLTAKAWKAILEDLPDHFGREVVVGPPGDLTELVEYSRRYAGRPGYGVLVNVDPDAHPRRITELPYFKTAHDDVPAEAMQAAGGAYHCESCHAAAGRGFYDRDTDLPAYEEGASEAVEGLPRMEDPPE